MHPSRFKRSCLGGAREYSFIRGWPNCAVGAMAALEEQTPRQRELTHVKRADAPWRGGAIVSRESSSRTTGFFTYIHPRTLVWVLVPQILTDPARRAPVLLPLPGRAANNFLVYVFFSRFSAEQCCHHNRHPTSKSSACLTPRQPKLPSASDTATPPENSQHDRRRAADTPKRTAPSSLLSPEPPPSSPLLRETKRKKSYPTETYSAAPRNPTPQERYR